MRSFSTAAHDFHLVTSARVEKIYKDSNINLKMSLKNKDCKMVTY